MRNPEMMTLCRNWILAVVYGVLVDVRPRGVFFFFPFPQWFCTRTVGIGYSRLIFYFRGVVYSQFCYEAVCF